MKGLIKAENTGRFLMSRSVSPKKRYGQNFLTDESVLERIIEAAELCSTDTVIEIGPGTGTLTQALAEKAGRVIAVEIDRDMIPILSERLHRYDHVDIVCADIMETDLPSLAAGGCVSVVANLPYYITTPVIMKLLREGRGLFSLIILMVQYEVAERILASPGGKDYGALTLAVQYDAEAELIMKVGAEAFWPEPAVDSAVVRLRPRPEPPVETDDEAGLFALIRAAFGQRRKTLVNALSGSADPAFSREDVRKALAEMGLDPMIRGERLSLQDFARLQKILQV